MVQTNTPVAVQPHHHLPYEGQAPLLNFEPAGPDTTAAPSWTNIPQAYVAENPTNTIAGTETFSHSRAYGYEGLESYIDDHVVVAQTQIPLTPEAGPGLLSSEATTSDGDFVQIPAAESVGYNPPTSRWWLSRRIAANFKPVTEFLCALTAQLPRKDFFNPIRLIWAKEDKKDAERTATSRSWLDTTACRWAGLSCSRNYQAPPNEDSNWDKDRLQDEFALGDIPEYVLRYAPIVRLSYKEQYWPCDMAGHLDHVVPQLNYTPVKPRWDHSTLRDLDKLNSWDKGRYVFLTSSDDVETRPDWLGGEENIPEPYNCQNEGLAPGHDGKDGNWRPQSDPNSYGEYFNRLLSEGDDHKETLVAGAVKSDNGKVDDNGSRRNANGHSEWADETASGEHVQSCAGGRSDAPAVLIVIDKGDGIVDAFWFYFYSYNLGNVVFGVRFGNHVGDWEHSLVRFHNGIPKAVFLSEHSFGEAYSYEAVEKIGQRPVIYSAEGSHAMYATPGTHAYILPWGLLHDETDRGPIWDPSLNMHAYTYTLATDTLRASNITPHSPTEWFYYAGHWGDKRYPLSDSRQYRFAGQYHYVNGPLGPRFKNLGRKRVCQRPPDDRPCVIRESIEEWVPRRWEYVGEGEEMSEEDYARFLAD